MGLLSSAASGASLGIDHHQLGAAAPLHKTQHSQVPINVLGQYQQVVSHLLGKNEHRVSSLCKCAQVRQHNAGLHALLQQAHDWTNLITCWVAHVVGHACFDETSDAVRRQAHQPDQGVAGAWTTAGPGMLILRGTWCRHLCVRGDRIQARWTSSKKAGRGAAVSTTVECTTVYMQATATVSVHALLCSCWWLMPLQILEACPC